MNIQLIIIGDEILIGKIKDLNTNTLAKSLRKTSFSLSRVHIISDSEVEILDTLEQVHKNGDIAIISGGLGPTDDDITKSSIAKYIKSDITTNQKANRLVLKQYKRGGREYTPDTHHYHTLPIGCEPLYNPTGFAPGIHYEKNYILFALPGVPHEFNSMLNESVLPLLEKIKAGEFTRYIVCKTHSLAESKIFNSIAPNLWEMLSKYSKVSSLPHIGGVDIALTINGKNTEELNQKQKDLTEILSSSPIVDNILHIGEDISLEELIIEEASKKGIKIGSAESCTGGLIASRLTDISGSSSCFWGSVISYSNEVKMKQLGVSEETLNDFGAVSKQTAYEMAEGARKNLNIDMAIATTGIAGPGGGSIDKPVGTVGIGISSKNGTSSTMYQFNGNREILKLRFSEIALITLLLELRSAS
jgi:nicotinamide-nucleotide amidase